MKNLDEFVIEKLKINKNVKIKEEKFLEPEDVIGPETPGKDYFDEDVIIIGWPFQKENDENHKKTKEYIKKEGYRIYNDLNEIEDQDMFDWFCYACHKDDSEVNCYVYGSEGAIALNEKY